MVHVPAKFRENTSFFSYSAKTKCDRRTDELTDGRRDGGRCNISRPRPSAPREMKMTSEIIRGEEGSVIIQTNSRYDL